MHLATFLWLKKIKVLNREVGSNASFKLQGRPCGFGQFLWLSNCLLNFSFLLVSQKNGPVWETGALFCSDFFENWSPSNQSLDKKIQRVDKKKRASLWDWTKSFWPTKKKWEIDQETGQNHTDVPRVADQKWPRQKSNVKVNFYI